MAAYACKNACLDEATGICFSLLLPEYIKLQAF